MDPQKAQPHKLGAPVPAPATTPYPALAGKARVTGDRTRADTSDTHRDSYSSIALQGLMNRAANATMARFTGGLSPGGLLSAYASWGIHLALAPGKQLQIIEKAARKTQRLAKYVGQCAVGRGRASPCIEPLPQDKRFEAEAWQKWPYNLICQSFLLNQQWWHNVTTGVPGVTQHHENIVEFATRQMLDAFSPSNFLLTNPEVHQKTRSERGKNLKRGILNFITDCGRTISGKRPAGTEEFELGRNLAATPGKIVYRNRLIELIQYQPATDKVHPEPILIVPAWIMKYYILDLTAENSLVKYLTEQGFTVYMVSWKNPDAEDRDLGMSDYRQLGIMSALDTIETISGAEQVHGVGYCLGGTLLAITAAAMARDDDNRFKSLSFFAGQIDFTEAGELMLFIGESQVNFLDNLMWDQGFLDTRQMAGAFQLLRSNDLVWSRMVRDYLMGERTEMNDLMTWNSDATRMPYKMHSQYLRQMFLNNDFAAGRYLVDDRPITASDIRAPILAVGTEHDHVAPWRSVYKFHLLTDTEVTFLLTNGGHNAGIVSEPGHPHRHYRVTTRQADERYVDPDSWLADTEVQDGSWWPAFVDWLKNRSGQPVSPPAMGAPGKGLAPICDAPGCYVLQD